MLTGTSGRRGAVSHQPQRRGRLRSQAGGGGGGPVSHQRPVPAVGPGRDGASTTHSGDRAVDGRGRSSTEALPIGSLPAGQICLKNGAASPLNHGSNYLYKFPM